MHHLRGPVRAVVFDFGGVLAEEGFKAGLEAIAAHKGLDPVDFYVRAEALVYSTGYVTGLADEATYWSALREKTGITGTDDEFRNEILERFVLRPEMLSCVRELRGRGLTVAILSDQTNWLAEIELRARFFSSFDHVFNSYVLGASKREAGTFSKVCGMMGIRPAEALFVDDNGGNVWRAAAEGLRTVHFLSFEDFLQRLTEHGMERCR